jgi:hypothetical protein
MGCLATANKEAGGNKVALLKTSKLAGLDFQFWPNIKIGNKRNTIAEYLIITDHF